MNKLLGCFIALTLLQACGEKQYADPNFYGSSVTGLNYSQKPVDPRAHIFLIAGSIRGANFAQEVVDQRKHWMSLGVPPEQIACYFVIPDKQNFDQDRDQYRELAPDLDECRIANLKVIRDDIASVAKDSSPYIYLTSHGSHPVDNSNEFLNHYFVVLDASPTGTMDMKNMVAQSRQGQLNADDFMLTPTALAGLLNQWPAATPKSVVIQACYSGGFLNTPYSPYAEETLGNSVSNLTALAAARFDRTSFGCGVDDKTTYFGGVVTDLISRENALPENLDWQTLYRAAVQEIQRKEAALNAQPSVPQFFSNR